MYLLPIYYLPVYSHNTTCVEHMPYLPYIPMMPCVSYLSYLSYIPHIPYIWNIITTPTIHTIPNIHVIPIIPTLHRKHSIPIIVTILTIHTIQTIHTVISNIPYPTDLHTILTIHTITTIHAIHSIPTIHTKHTILSKHAIPDRPYTPYIPNIPYHTPTTPQGGRGTVPPPPHHRGEGEDLTWGQYMGPIQWGGVAGPGAFFIHNLIFSVYLYITSLLYLYIHWPKMGGSSGAYAKRGRRAKAEAALRDMSRAGLGVEGWDPWELREKPWRVDVPWWRSKKTDQWMVNGCPSPAKTVE